MQGYQLYNNAHPSSHFASALHHANSLFTPKRVGYTLAGAFVFAGAAVAMNGGGGNTTPSQVKGYTIQTTSDTSSASATDSSVPSDGAASTNTTFSANTSGDGTSKVQLNVNGQDIPVPANGSSHQTVTNSNGSTTTVDVNGNTTTQGSATNSSSTTFNLNVNSSSSASGGTTSQ